MREKYIYEFIEDKTREEIIEILVKVLMTFFKVNDKKATELWYGTNGIVYKNKI